MKTIKKLLFLLVSYSIRLVLFATITVWILVLTVGKPEKTKQIIAANNAYERFVPSVINANKSLPTSEGSINYDDPKISNIIYASFPASDIKNAAENVIDGTYNWLSGTSKELVFRADFSSNKIKLAEALSGYAFDRLKTLPDCIQQPSAVNPLTINCRPEGFNDPKVKQAYLQQLISSDTFLAKSVFTAQDLPKNSAGKTLPQTYSFAPTLYKWLLRAPYLLLSLTLLMCGLYVLLSPNKRRGVSGLGLIFITSGFSLAIFPILFDVVLPRFTKSFQSPTQSTGPQTIISDIVSHVTHRFDSAFITVGIQLFIAGISIYLLEKATKNPISKYKNVAKKSGLTSSNQKRTKNDPKSLRGKLNQQNIPLQSSDSKDSKTSSKIAQNDKYRKLYQKKGL